MRIVLLLLFGLIYNISFSQEPKVKEEFLPIVLEGKDAFLSTKTGEYVFRSHADTDPEALTTTASGVVYKDVKYHTVKKRETLFKLAQIYDVSVESLKKDNQLTKADLSIGQKIKITKNLLVQSSSPVTSFNGEERIIAKLNPGQSPSTLNPPASTPNSQQTPQEAKVTDIEQKTDREKNNSENQSVHTVKPGETLFSIAKKYNITVQKLKEQNGLTLNNLSVGQKLNLQ